MSAQAEQRLLTLLGPAAPEPAAPEPKQGWTPDLGEPPPAPARVDPGRHGALALVAVALVVVVLVAAQAYRSRPRPADVPRTLAVPSAAPSNAGGVVVVDVEGAVRRPGLFSLPRGSRVADAIRAAGGVTPGAQAGVNLARLLVDGEQLVVGESAPGASAPEAARGGLLDLNAATVAELDSLPGVGPVLAQRIVDWRTAHGPFRDVSQLREVSGIGERKYADIAARVRV